MFKRASFHSIEGNDEGTIQARYEWAVKVKNSDEFSQELRFH